MVHGHAEAFDIAGLGNFATSTLDRSDREAIAAASWLADDRRPALARTAAKRRLVSTVVEAGLKSLGQLIELIHARLGTSSIPVGADVIDRIDDVKSEDLLRFTKPGAPIEPVTHWGGFFWSQLKRSARCHLKHRV